MVRGILALPGNSRRWLGSTGARTVEQMAPRGNLRRVPQHQVARGRDADCGQA